MNIIEAFSTLVADGVFIRRAAWKNTGGDFGHYVFVQRKRLMFYYWDDDLLPRPPAPFHPGLDDVLADDWVTLDRTYAAEVKPAYDAYQRALREAVNRHGERIMQEEWKKG